MDIPAPVARHPYLFGTAAAAVVLLLVMRGGKSSAQPAQTAIVSSGVDPTAAALTAQQMQTNAALTAKQIDAQTQVAGFNALQAISLNNDMAQMHVADITANTVNAKTVAGIFATAVSGLTLNNNMAGNAGTMDLNGVTTGVANGTALVPGGPGWQSWMNPFAHSGKAVPIMSPNATPVQATNTTNNQIEELFNNVIRAGQGTAPMQTVTMQPSGGGGSTQVGTATIDPVFAVWDGHGGVPTITDITLNDQSQYGYTGSVYTPGSAAAVNITPDAIKAPPPPAAAQLPNFNVPNFNWWG